MSSSPLFPQVLNQINSADQVTLELRIPADLHYFEGHFPEAPILPGVVQSHWVLEYIHQFFGIDPSGFSAFSNLKFQQMIRPDYQVTLVIKPINDKKLSFSYSSEYGQHSSGKVLYD